MNIYKFELKSQFKSFIIWTISLIATLFLIMGGIYPVFQDSAADLLEVLEGFPKQFTQAFGLQVSNLFSYGGFYSFAFIYMSLIAVIMAVVVALSIFAREKRMKCMDFLLSKPISRQKIFWVKLLVCLTIIGVTNVIYISCNLFIFNLNNQSSQISGRFVLASLGVFFTQLIFLSIGLFIATFAKKIRSVSGLASSIGFIAFILFSISNILNEDVLNFLAPLKYFDPSVVMLEGFYEAKYIASAILIILFCTITSYIRFCKSDIHAV